MRALLRLISASSLLFVAVAAAQVAVPPLKERVTDLTGTLSAEQRSALEQTLAEFEKRKGTQIAVLLVPTAKPEPVEAFAVRVQESWKLGRKGVDDGVLIAIAKEDRAAHIEVGYGLEGALPDAIAKRIGEEEMVPRFRQGDFYGGIRSAADRIMRVIEGEPLPAPRRGAERSASRGLDGIVPLLFFVLVFGGILRAILGRFLGGAAAGGIAGFATWVLTGTLAIALVAGLLGFVAILMGGGMRRGYYGGGWNSRGGWGGGGFGGGGGFRGGGGLSGGGGASIRW